MTIYQKQLEWAKERGLFLDPRVERKCVDGIWGFFATDNIKAGSKLVSYPERRAIKNLPDNHYSKDVGLAIKNIHKSVLEYAKGEASEYWGHFVAFESLEELRKVSCFFYTNDDIKYLASMSEFLGSGVMDMNSLTRSRLEAIKSLEPSIDPDLILQVCLNYSSRAWDDSNFLPIIDYANHSDRLGNLRQLRNGEYLIDAKYDYKAGDQIFISYARKDMYHHATLFNYFDPNGRHYIHFGTRFTQQASTPSGKEIVKFTAQKFSLEVVPNGDVWMYFCRDPHVCFLETGPSLKLIDYIRVNYLPTEAEKKQKQCSDMSLAQRLLEVINAMLNANKVDDFKLSEVPSRFHRFYHMLKKEKQMLEANKHWVIDNFYL
jgi:hypothetical protein